MEKTMTHEKYEKLRAKNKKLFKDSCVSSFNQELSEIQQSHPHVIDFYWAEHYGYWVLRSTKNELDMEEFDTKSELIHSLEVH